MKLYERQPYLAAENDSMEVHFKPTPHPVAGISNRSVSKSYQKIPRHIQKMKNQAEEKKIRQSLTVLNMKATNGKVFDDELSGQKEFNNSPASSFSESSETESQQDIGADFVGFKKTRDFGDFVTFSNSPSHLWELILNYWYLIIISA